MNLLKTAILLLLTLFGGCGRNSTDGVLEVTYIGNEGFMIALGDSKVLIDALTDSKNYVHPSDSLVARVMDGASPFDKVDYFLVTHDHADHFHAGMASSYLLKHPAVRFIANPQTINRLAQYNLAERQCTAVDLERGGHKTIHEGECEVTGLRLDHGGSHEINNVAYIVSANGYTFVHVGDARLPENVEFLRSIVWTSRRIDLLFIEYFDRGSDVQEVIEKLIRPKYVVLMHVPGGEEEAVRNSDEKVHPRTFVFGNENETKRFDNL
jgi:L-ascorbate metabolism protein UlaG (beta-lactamase superfamily)